MSEDSESGGLGEGKDGEIDGNGPKVMCSPLPLWGGSPRVC